MKKVLGLLATMLLASIALAQTPATHSVDWKWTAPAQFADGTAIPSTDTITYNLYLGSAPGAEATTPVQTGVTALTATSTGYTAGQTVCGEVTAVVNGLESPRSNESCVTFPVAPAAPTGFTATPH